MTNSSPVISAIEVPVYKGAPIVGVIPQVLNGLFDFIHKTVPARGDVMCVPIGTRKFYIFSHPDAFQHVLRDHNRNYIKRGTVEPFLRITGKALVNTDGDEWFGRRKMFQPYFHMKRLSTIVDVMNISLEKQIARIMPLVGSNTDFTGVLRKLTLHIFMTAFYGDLFTDEEADQVGDALSYALKYSFKLEQVPIRAIMRPGKARFDQSVATITGITQRLIARKRQMNGTDSDLLSMLIESTETGNLTDQELANEAASLFLGGWETSSGTMGWLFYELSRRPDIEQKLVTEYQQVLNGRFANFEDSRQLVYTQALIDETLRVYPIAHAINRMSLNEDVVGGYRIPAGSNILLAVHNVHHSGRFWDDAEMFQPERFVENRKPSHTFAYVPFGSGPRQCIGNDFAKLEMQLIVSALVQRFRFQLAPDFKPEPSTDATYQLKQLPITLIARSSP